MERPPKKLDSRDQPEDQKTALRSDQYHSSIGRTLKKTKNKSQSPSGGKTIGISGTHTMGQAVLFKLRMGLTLTQVTKTEEGAPGSRKK